MSKLFQKLDTIGVLLLVATVIRYSVHNIWDVWATVLLVLGGAAIVVGLAANYKQIMLTLGKRSTKYFTNYVISVGLVLALVAGLNFIGQRHSKRFDMTSSGQYTLAPQSTQVLGKLDRDLELKVFFPSGAYAPLKDLLEKYQGTNHHVRYEFIDPDKSPERARQYDVKVYGVVPDMSSGRVLSYGTVVLLYGQRVEKIEKRQQEISEQDLTNAIIRIERSEKKKIYFLQGNGEKDPANTERDGYGLVKKALEDQNFVVDNLNLAGKREVPADAKVLIEAGPTAEPMPEQTQLWTDFMNRGGGMLVLVDPSPAANLGPFLTGWGVVPDNDLVVSPTGYVRSPAWPAITRSEYESHPVTDRFSLNTFFPMVRSLQAAKSNPAGVTTTVLFKSMPESWGKGDLKDLKNATMTFNQKSDLKGPLPLAIAVSKEIKPAVDGGGAASTRMVVVGNSTFGVNAFVQSEGNSNLFLNMVSWLAQEEDLISVRPKAPEDRKIMLTESQQRMLQILVLFLLPGSVLVAGIIVWTRRRR